MNLIYLIMIFMQLNNFGQHLFSARQNSGFTQEQLAKGCNLHQSIISAMENGKRLPTIPQLLQLATVLKVPLQWFLTGANRAGNELPDFSIQLQALGIADLQVTNELVPGSFLHDEEVFALAVAGNTPSARIIEAMPALLAWNVKNPFTLRTFADLYDPRIKYRLGWLADIAITIHQGQGFPGGCPYFSNLEVFVRNLQPDLKSLDYEDSFGFENELQQRPTVSLRWRMRYPAQLSAFRERAERLHAMRAEKYF